MEPLVIKINLPLGYIELGFYLVLSKALLYSPLFFWLYTPWWNISNLPLDKEEDLDLNI